MQLKEQLLGRSEQQGPSLVDQLKPMVNDPVSDFLVSFMDVADRKGVLDQAFGPQTVADQADSVDQNADPMELLDINDLKLLVGKYLAIPEPMRSQIGNKIKSSMPPQVAQRLDAAVRLVQRGQ